LIAKTELVVGDVKTKNILIDGIARINSDLEIEMRYLNAKIKSNIKSII
jgi:hypothetical protein